MGVQRALRATAILFALCIAIALRLRVSHLGRSWHVGGPLHPVVHIALFGALAALLMLSSTSRHHRWLSFAAVVLLGAGTEYYEHLRDGFPVERGDVIADSGGAAIALIVVTTLSSPSPASRYEGFPERR